MEAPLWNKGASKIKSVFKCEECGTTFKQKEILGDVKFTGLLAEGCSV